jgi:hypothetical protein
VRVCITGFGANWWSAHSRDLGDPFCFRRGAAWFNSAALKFGRRLCFYWIVPGQIRFNQTSGFNPQFANRFLGATFECSGPQLHSGRIHLLFTKQLRHAAPEAYLVTINHLLHGAIAFEDLEWKSSGTTAISISRKVWRYEAMLLMGRNDWIKTDLGRWRIADREQRLMISVE